MNVLILSCGTRNKIVRYFKKELAGKGMVLAADCSSLAPALYDADKHFIVPKITDNKYLDTCSIYLQGE
jgi:carbamoyl-phosphate synthase large subunit